ncbi:hypothetical protein BV898_12165 [Hypsibius exemplaris]|uniref:Uncharacterized protein n=1 Tax=Hypsibius exemplaris TaxID=2072580 RepID=A0A1W0WEM0_HYPEX|nr:hypothetical protein BV898_12165 [Hypsibius exemplaris]
MARLRLALDRNKTLPESEGILRGDLIGELTAIRRCQMEILNFYTEVDAFFRNIFFFSHFLDQACTMGFVATVIITDPSKNLGDWLYNCLSIMFFVGYSTVLLLPLAHVYEEAESTNFQVYQLSLAIRRNFPGEASDSQVHEILQALMGSSERNSIVLQGSGCINFTRPWFAGTVTLGLSFSVLAYEITQRSNSRS